MKRRKHTANNRFLLLYGSQTGQAKAIAEEISDTASNFGLIADLHCLSLTEKRFSIEQESCAVFIVSTTGDGDPPDTAVKFFRRISKHTLDAKHLQNLRYAILALGDSNYSTFCIFGKQLERVLQSLSAEPFFPTGYADDARGIEKVADPWIESLFPAIRQKLGLPIVCDLTYSIDNSDSRRLSDLVLEAILSTDKANKTENFQLNGFTEHSVLTNNMTSNESDKETKNALIYSILSTVEIIRGNELRMPVLPPPFLLLSYSQDQKDQEIHSIVLERNTSLISAASSLVNVHLDCSKKWTEGVDVKEAYELTFKFMSDKIPYEPGDSFGFICKNSDEEVTTLLERLGVVHLCDQPCKLSIYKEYSSKKKSLVHLPGSSTLKEIFLTCCDIRSVPKKVLFRILSEYATNEDDKLCLQFLCSQEGAPLFTEYVRSPSLSLIDILYVFKSCMPPVERILEYIPVLKPRFYSVASSPLVDSSLFGVVFNVVHINEGDGRYKCRKGVCTGWLGQMVPKIHTSNNVADNVDELASNMEAFSLNSKDQEIQVYKRQNHYFHLPNDPSVPVIMIGPGTGVAPFVGFLQHREQQMKMNPTCTYGEMWLFYGCRHREKDFLFRDELTRLQSCNVLSNLVTCFSRDSSSETACPRYVQDNIKLYAKDIERIIDNGGHVYVCGDAKHMAPDVFQAFVEVMETAKDISKSEALALIKNLEGQKKYVIDVWT